MVSLREMARADAERVPLLSAKFFEPCPEHPEPSRATRSGGCNLFCIDCTGRPLCHACVTANHVDHQVIQVRKSSRHDVVKVKDLEALLGVDGVKEYSINNEAIVFLNPRPQMGNGKPGPDRCNNCSRALQEKDVRFCSLKCKLECMEWDINVSFAPQAESESKSAEDEAQTNDDGAGTRAAPAVSPANTSASGSSGHH